MPSTLPGRASSTSARASRPPSFSCSATCRLPLAPRLSRHSSRSGPASFAGARSIPRQCGNNRPRIPGGADPGLAGRIINVTFPTIPDEQLDDRLNSKIESELPRIVSWAREGARAYLDTGRLPAIPERWRESTSHYLAVEDTIGGWFDERCELQPRAFSTYQVLTEDFTQHTGERITGTQLGDWFDQRGLQGVRRHRTKSGRGIQGVALRPRIPQARRVTGDANDATSR